MFIDPAELDLVDMELDVEERLTQREASFLGLAADIGRKEPDVDLEIGAPISFDTITSSARHALETAVA
jgi:hypothetical protein